MHWQLKTVVNGIRHVAIRSIHCKWQQIKCEEGIISFTFDDFFGSAASVGTKLLERQGFYGTFYVSGGLIGQSWETEPHATAEQIIDLADRGHEIGCHTFEHSLVSQIGARDIGATCDRNQRWL